MSRAQQSSASAAAPSSTSGSATSILGQTATDIYASSIAVPSRTSVSRLEAQLNEVAVQKTPFVQRDVQCSRIDDEDERQKEIEADAMYTPVRKARLQSRLQLRFENGAIEMRLYAKPAGKGAEHCSLYNLIRVPLNGQAEDGTLSSSSTVMQPHVEKQARLALEINAGQGEWQQIIHAMGWTPKHNTVRQGYRFVLRDDSNCRVEALLFRLCKVNDTTSPSSFSIQPIAKTQVLQVVATLPLAIHKNSKSNNIDSSQGEKQELDASQVAKQALAEIAAVQSALQGLVQLSKEDDS